MEHAFSFHFNPASVTLINMKPCMQSMESIIIHYPCHSMSTFEPGCPFHVRRTQNWRLKKIMSS